VAIKLRKTVVVGVGGTGLKALLYMKKEFLDHFGEVPPLVRLLCFDTAVPDSFVNDARGRRVTLEGSEFTYIPVNNPVSLLEEFPEVRKEFPLGKVELRALLDGAGSVRACGRLAVLANALQIHNLLEDAREDVTAAASKDYVRDSKVFSVSPDPKTTYYVVCSIAGGTGGGGFLDFAYLIRHVMRPNDRIIGIFLMPEIFSGFPATSYVKGNAYAALKELDFLTDRAGLQQPSDLVDYGSAIRTDWAKRYPFDQVYLLDNKNELGETFNDLEQLQRFLGRALFVNTTAVVKKNDDVMDNVAGQNATSERWKEKRPNYASFGAAAIELPIDRILELAVLSKVANLLGDMLSGAKASLEEDVTTFIRSSGLDEFGTEDDVVDAILKPAQAATHTAPDVLESDNPESCILDWVRRERAAIDSVYDRVGGENCAKTVSAAKESISASIGRGVMTSGGVDYCRAFSAALAVRLDQSRKMMDQERAQHETKRDAVRSKYPTAETVEKTCKGYFSKPKIEKLVRDLGVQLSDDSTATFEIVRRKYAADVFTALIQYALQFRDTLDLVSRALAEASSYVGGRIQEVRGMKGVNTFTKYVDGDAMSSEIDGIGSQTTTEWVLGRLAAVGVTPLAWATPEWEGRAIAERLRNTVLVKYEELRNIGMERVLDNLRARDETKLYDMLQSYLVDRATPLWMYDVDAAKRRNLTEIFIFGVRNEDATVLKEFDATRFGTATRRASWASTGSVYTLSAFKYKLRVPAYALLNIRELKEEYASREGRDDFTYHVRRVWADNPDLLGDLIPEQALGTDEQLMYWAVGFAPPFSRIIDVPGGRYYIISKQLGEETQGYKVLLSQGRVKAYEAFVSGEHRDELFAELKEAVDSIVANLGVDHVVASLAEYRKRILDLTAKRKVAKEIERMLNLELNATDRFVERITTLR
jgi:hypothetical protein